MTKQKTKVVVLGCGSFGTAMAHVLSYNDIDLVLWGREQAAVDEINKKQTNSKYMPYAKKLNSLEATTDIDHALRNADMILFAIPCQALRGFLLQIKDKLPEKALLINLAKGIEIDSLDTASQIFATALGKKALERYVILSGPTFSKELFLGYPTGATVAGTNLKNAQNVQKTLGTKYFRLYTAKDFVGVELGGALKNVMAIGVGIADGLGYGLNTRAGLITRCLHESIELGLAMGAKERTFSGLSGIGDLLLTCTGDLSRNRQVGLRLGQGESLEKITKSMNAVAEGIPTAKSVYALMQKHGIDMPNAEHTYRILYENMPAKKAVESLLKRELKRES
jgi:glycerol-3-phosphate dehydrogenase (NAD(P)+)